MPVDIKLYPRNWKQISQRIKERAGWRCEWCGAVHGQPHPVTGSIVVLTTMHLDHDPQNCDESNLRAACQRCHNRYDRQHRDVNASHTRALKRAGPTIPLDISVEME